MVLLMSHDSQLIDDFIGRQRWPTHSLLLVQLLGSYNLQNSDILDMLELTRGNCEHFANRKHFCSSDEERCEEYFMQIQGPVENLASVPSPSLSSAHWDQSSTLWQTLVYFTVRYKSGKCTILLCNNYLL
jgi:hypothetical protein